MHATEQSYRPFPRFPLFAAGSLIALTIVLSLAGRYADIGTLRMPASEAVEMRELRFADQADGSVAVHLASDGTMVEVIEPGTNGFMRSVMRGLARERRMHGIGAEPPFVVARRADGRLSLEDSATGRRIELDAFGPTNAGAFARLLTLGSDVQ